MFKRSMVFLAFFFLLGCGGGGGDAGPGSAGGGQPVALGNGASNAVVSADNGAIAVAPPADSEPAANPAPAPADSPEDQQLRAAMAQAGVTSLAAVAQDPAKVALGEALMFDKILSGNKDISCATCHHPTQGSGDGLSVSIGTGGSGLGPARQLGAGRNFIPRNAPPLWNLASTETLFWDGRVSGNLGNGFSTPAGAVLPAGLEHAVAAQAMFPVTNRDEMRGNAGDLASDGSFNELAAFADNDFNSIWAALMARLMAIPAYVDMFAAAFPEVPQDQLGFQHAANAIGAFELSAFGLQNSPFDRYVAGDSSALDEAQKRGGQLFYGRARCAQCHRGPLLSDFAFHNIAAPQVGPGAGDEAPLDFGRGRVTGQQNDRFRFRTPILRNVAQTGPWMHAGAYTSLNAAVAHYRNPAASLRNYNPNQLQPRFRNQVHTQEQIDAGILNNLDPLLAPVQLNQGEVNDLVAFLESLSDPGATQLSPPADVPSGLPVD